MLKELVLKQKSERDRLLSMSYVERDKKMEARKWLHSDLIKVVLGPRRAGKSVFCLTLLQDQPFLYFNFDDEGLPGNEHLHHDELMKELHVAYGETKNIFFDEIQNVPKWEFFVNRLHREGYNIVLSGSNANLLSRELATALTGRHIPIEILPFNFNEFLRAKKFVYSPDSLALPEEKAQLLSYLEQYLLNGGFPEVVVKDLDAKGYLGVLYDSLLFKDVVRRHRVRYAEEISDLGSYVMSNAAHLYSIRRLARVLHFRSNTTLEKYLRYLIEAYLLFSLGRYSHKAGERLKSPRKMYAVDTGFTLAKAVQHSPDTGKLLENLVFIELVKHGYHPNHDIFYYRTKNNREVDFMLKKGVDTAELIQVAYQTNDDVALAREIKALREASEELKTEALMLITWDDEKQIKKDGKTVQCVPIWKWLLRERY